MKTSVNYATYKSPERLEALKQSVESIIDQVDVVRIHWNGYDYFEIPEWYRTNQKIKNSIGDNFTDNGKFVGLQDDPLQFDEFYLTADDDIIFPPDYVAWTVAHLRWNPIVSYHGRQLQTTGNFTESYYRGGHLVYDFRCDVEAIIPVDVVGTGVAGFDTRIFKPIELYKSKLQRMSDLIFSLEATRQGVPMVVIPHRQGWIKSIQMKESICQTQQQLDQTEHCRIVWEILNLKE